MPIKDMDNRAGLPGNWKNAGMKLLLRLENDPAGWGGPENRPFSAPARAPLPEDKGSAEIAGSVKDTSNFKWTEALDHEHTRQVRGVIRGLEWTTSRRATTMQGVVARAQASCHMESHRASFLALVDGLSKAPSKANGGGGASPRPQTPGSSPSSAVAVTSAFTSASSMSHAAGPAGSGSGGSARAAAKAASAAALLEYNRRPGHIHRLDNLPTHVRRLHANRSAAAATPKGAQQKEQPLQQPQEQASENAASSRRSIPSSSLFRHPDLPPGVPPWAVVSPVRVVRPTPPHGRFVAASAQRRTAHACELLRATPRVPNHNAARRTSLAQDISDLVGVLHAIDDKVCGVRGRLSTCLR
jgi:hypothetical protein